MSRLQSGTTPADPTGSKRDVTGRARAAEDPTSRRAPTCARPNRRSGSAGTSRRPGPLRRQRGRSRRHTGGDGGVHRAARAPYAGPAARAGVRQRTAGRMSPCGSDRSLRSGEPRYEPLAAGGGRSSCPYSAYVHTLAVRGQLSTEGGQVGLAVVIELVAGAATESDRVGVGPGPAGVVAAHVDVGDR